MSALGVGAALACSALACTAPTPEERGAPRRELPPVDELPEIEALPDLFASFFDDARVESAEDFSSWRRDELLALFAHYVYGPAPDVTAAGDAVERERIAAVDGGAVDLVELELPLSTGRTLHVAVFTPAEAAGGAPGVAPGVAAVLGPNKCGNQSMVADERVRATDAYLAPACEGGARGMQSDAWPVADIAAAGLALVTWHESELAPDHIDEAAAFASGPVLSAWAHGNALALDLLEARARDGDGTVDVARVAVFGHSRRGKAALLTAARDRRFAAVVAHQSGTCGAAVLRNQLGESLLLITGVYPHWFTDELATFVGQETRLPVDQHMLLALAAPRPLLLVDGDEDDWADPSGALDAARAADAAWELFGADGLVEEDGAPRLDATVVWRTRPGGHSVTSADWQLFLPFLVARLAE